MFTKRALNYRVVGAASGLLLGIPNLYPAASWLQALAFVPILYLGATRNARHRDMFLAGIYMGLGYILPQLIAMRFPMLITLILLIHFTVLMTALACISAKLTRGPALLAPFAVGAFLVVLDWANFTVIPIWGTAQSFVRCWSRYPYLILFTSLTGITGIIFVLGTLQALAVNFIIRPKVRIRLLITAIVVIVIFASANLVIQGRQPADKLKVAAVGWTYTGSANEHNPQTPEGFDVLFARPVAKAADEGAKLIVSGELGFYIDRYEREKWLGRFGEIARRHNVFLVIGYLDADKHEDRLLFMNPEGKVLAEYTKTYLTPFEDFHKGTGQLSVIDVEGVRTGGMVCQDDNFPRLSRHYGRERVGVVAVPTLDWSQVKDAHLQSSIHRAIESRYAIVRAAINGISVIVSPTGEVLARCDHFAQGPGVIVAEVPVYTHRTLFSILGHWPVVVSVVFLAIYIGQGLLGHPLSRRWRY